MLLDTGAKLDLWKPSSKALFNSLVIKLNVLAEDYIVGHNDARSLTFIKKHGGHLSHLDSLDNVKVVYIRSTLCYIR